MTTITIERTILDRLIETWDSTVLPTHRDGMMQERMEDLRAALAAPDDIAAEMSTVADQYAHKLALDLECVLADYSGTWYDAAIRTLGAYRDAMNAIHERESPTFMGEPVLRDEPDKPADKPPTPAWHDAPTEPGIWLCDEGGPDCYTSTAHNIVLLNDPALKDDGCRWYGPIPQDGAKAEGRKE